jgi:glucosamine-6-phosphate deaminase
MKVRVCDAIAEVATTGADRLVSAAAANPELVLGLATGRTMVPFYAELARRHGAGRLDLSRARAFHLDELALPAADPRSFHSYSERHAGARIGLDPRRVELPRAEGDLPALERECLRYEAALREAGGLDLAILGLGADGHVAYNLPGPPWDETHVVELPRRLADELGVPPLERPLRAITLGFGALRAARSVLVLATGQSKLAAVRALRDGPADPSWPCSLLREHPALELIVDRAAAPTRGRA